MASKRWAKRNPEKCKERAAIQHKAASAFPERQECSIKGCEEPGERHHPDYSKPTEIIWLCKKHHEMVHHSEYRRCSIEGCDRKHMAKGLCHPCYKKQRRAKGFAKNSA